MNRYFKDIPENHNTDEAETSKFGTATSKTIIETVFNENQKT